jgi:hypothetical protein
VERASDVIVSLSFIETTGDGFVVGLVSGTRGTDLKPRSSPVAALLLVGELLSWELEEIVSALIVSLLVAGFDVGCVSGILSDADCGVSTKVDALEVLNKLLKTVSEPLSLWMVVAFAWLGEIDKDFAVDTRGPTVGAPGRFDVALAFESSRKDAVSWSPIGAIDSFGRAISISGVLLQ